MGLKMPPGASGKMPLRPYAYAPSLEELRHKLLWAMGRTEQDLDNDSVGITEINRFGNDVVVTVYSGGKFSTHTDKITSFPSQALIDRLRLLF